MEHIYFLQKPVDRDRLCQAIKRAAARLEAIHRQCFVLSGRGETVNIPLNRILYFEKEKRKIHMHIKSARAAERTGSQSYSFYGRFSDIEEQLDGRFQRCHNSYIVNMQQVQRMADKKFFFTDEKTIPISRTYYQDAKEAFLSYLGQKKAVCMIAKPEQVSAASKPYMQIDNYNYSTGKPFEKIGTYYIWMQRKDNVGLIKCSASLKGKAAIIKKVSGEKYYMGSELVTNGNTIYYGIDNRASATYSIYKTNVKAAKSKKIVTVKGVSEAGGCCLSGYYNGKLYFCMLTDWGDTSTVYVHDIAKKRTKVLRQDGYAYSSYGPYILTDQRSWGHSWKLYNAKTNKFTKITKLGDASEPVVYGTHIYSYKSDGKSDAVLITRYDWSSKKMKTLKKLKHASVVHMGKKAVYYTVGDSEKVQKWNYK